MKKLVVFLASLLFVCIHIVQAQTIKISGTVTSSEDGMPLPGVSVIVKGTTIGGATDANGKYEINVPTSSQTLTFSYVGFKVQEVAIVGRVLIDVVLVSESLEMKEVVVTALGITREKKALGYSVQEVSGEQISTARETNFVTSLSGKVSGVSIKQPNTMGGSANIVIRGTSSLLGNNQALFVVDGVPIDNSNTNSENQQSGGGGFDYGNAASDINPDDVESISVLKGAAASALYGSRASNGVILVTTKKGKKGKQGIGVSVNSGVVWSVVDKATMPKYQKEYGGGYGPYYDDASGYFLVDDLDGDGDTELICPIFDDASWGHKFDKNLNVVQFDALDPLEDNYAQATPWVFPKNSLETFWETGVKYSNSVALTGGTDKGSFRLSYTNVDETGIMVKSSLKRNTVNLSGSYDFTKKFTAEANANYVSNKNVGRFGTGYDEYNVMQVFGQWFQTNVDFEKLKKYKSSIDGTHRTWNYTDLPTVEPLTAYYANNPYWTRYENYNNDGRDRFYGYAKLNYKLTDWVDITGRVATDYYAEYQEQRIAVGSAVAGDLPDYTRYDRTFNELNADLMASFKKDFGDLSMNGLLGTSTRKNTIRAIQGTTVGGLSVPGYYSLDNSIAPVVTTEEDVERRINSFYGSLSTGFKRMLFVDVTARYDISSTLPEDNNSYFYPSISTSFIVSEIPVVKDLAYVSLIKIRANYAEVGADAPAYNTKSAYFTGRPWGHLGLFSMRNTLFNPALLPERTKSVEFGLEANFFNNRLGFDFSFYKNNSFDQIMPIEVSRASGYSAMYINAGEIENRGYELALKGTPVATKDFTWNIGLNWFKNENTVVDLGKDIDNILLFSAWDVSVNAREGQPYGAIVGTDFVYLNGKKVVGSDGYYLKSDEEKVIGNINPDWNAGISNTFTYKGVVLSALVDIQQGGDIYSINTKYGLSTGLYEETAGLNDKGNPKRDLVADGGGILFPNTVYEDGTPNATYVEANEWGTAWDYDASPTARYIYDASYVKLREVTLGYNLPQQWLAKTFVKSATISFVGRNLWIIHKNVNHFDPEAAVSSGNLQGIESGSYPTTRTFGFNLKLDF